MQKQNEPLVIERIIDAPIDLVWKSLTDIELLKLWLPFFPAFKAEVGFEIRFLLGRDADHQYLHICEVTEVIKRKKLTYSWRYDGYKGNSFVTYELFPEGKKTKVILTHRITEPFQEDNPDFAESNFKEGWTYTIEGLKTFVEKNNL